MRKILAVCFCVHLLLVISFAQKVPSPKEVLGFTPGDDRKLASWEKTVEYFRKLDAASDRIIFQEIGKSTMGKPFVYATISAPANLKNLAKYKQINKKLADPRLIKSNQKLANDLIKQGKTIVLITYGIHSTEVGSYLSSMLTAHRLASSNETEILKILENTIILIVPSLNPDGVDIVKNWYDKTLGTPFEGTNPPELYHKYTGHDNNRDWYAFTQVETRLTVEKIHNEWHPQIVQDVHQQGAFGARIFVPPYLPPVEPNVPPQIIEGFTELGTFIANQMRQNGFQGITTDSTYDAWTPARAYSHYHGGVRILTEVASARLATPINVKFEELRGDLGYDAKKESKNFSPVWKGGEWRLRDITNYMTASSFYLLKHASDNRQKWLTRFYSIGKEAVRPRKKGELVAYATEIDTDLKEILEIAGVESKQIQILNAGIDGKPILLIKMAQPYSAFAKAILEPQKYPNLKDEKGNPIPPYDVTAHTLSLLFNTKAIPIYEPIRYPKIGGFSLSIGDGIGDREQKSAFIFSLYRSYIPSMDEGWSRWVLERNDHLLPSRDLYEYQLNTLVNENIRTNQFENSKTIIFPDQPANQILNGFAKGTMPDEYTGGIGREGVENLRKFVEDGGTLIFLNRASNFAIEQFGLSVRDVTKDLPRKDFYIPGSILQTELDTNHPIAKRMPKESIAWFENSPAFEITASGDTNIEIIAKYPNDPNKILLSGWALGTEKIAGKAALVSIKIGRGKIVLFGFRPQYRGQSLATFPLLFNAINQ